MTTLPILFMSSPTWAADTDDNGPTAEITHEVADEAEDSTKINIEIDVDEDETWVFGDDLFIMADQHTLASAADNVFALGDSVVLPAEHLIEGDLFVAAKKLQIEGEVLGDVYGAAQSLTIAPDAKVHGSVLTAVESLDIDGVVGGAILGAMARAELDGPIGGDVELHLAELNISEKARIGGDLHYFAPQQATIPSGVVSGDTDFSKKEHDKGKSSEPGVLGAILWQLWAYVGALTLGFVWLIAGGTTATRPGQLLEQAPTKAMAIGFGLVCAIPVLALLAMVTVVPFPLGLVSAIVYLILLYAAKLIASHALGGAVLQRVRPDEQASPYVAMAIGLAMLSLVMMIPVVGVLVWLIATASGFGGLYLAYAQNRVAQS